MKSSVVPISAWSSTTHEEVRHVRMAIQRASIIRAKGGVVEPLDCPCCGKVAPLRSCVVEIVGEVGAHDDQSSLAKHLLDDQRHLFRGSVANEQWDNGEVLKQALKKWQFDLKRVLGRMRGVVDRDEPGVSQKTPPH